MSYVWSDHVIVYGSSDNILLHDDRVRLPGLDSSLVQLLLPWQRQHA